MNKSDYLKIHNAVRVFKNDAHLQKPFPLLIHFSDTGEAPENLNAAPEVLNTTTTPEDLQMKFGNFFGKVI